MGYCNSCGCTCKWSTLVIHRLTENLFLLSMYLHCPYPWVYVWIKVTSARFCKVLVVLGFEDYFEPNTGVIQRQCLCCIPVIRANCADTETKPTIWHLPGRTLKSVACKLELQNLTFKFHFITLQVGSPKVWVVVSKNWQWLICSSHMSYVHITNCTFHISASKLTCCPAKMSDIVRLYFT